MPVTRCPGCQASLEVPSVVPGGLVACPYCGEEFAPSGRSAGARRSASRRRGGRRDHDDYDDEGYRRGGYRRRSDPVPIIVGVVALVVIGGVVAFFATKGSRERAAREKEAVAEIAKTPPAYCEMKRSPDQPSGRTFDLECDFREGDRVTIQNLTLSTNLKPPPELGEAGGLMGFTFDLETASEGSEKITSANDSGATHEGTYKVKTYIWNHRAIIDAPTEIGARFRTDRKGNLVPGSFSQTSGPTLTPAPQFLGVRGFGILPSRPIQHMETWGTSSLQDPFAGRVILNGRPLEDYRLAPSRQGGWRFEGGTLERREDGRWTRAAGIEMQLIAVENSINRNATFGGEPAEISKSLSWDGKATFMLKKQVLQDVQIDVTLHVRVKTRTKVYDWSGLSSTGYRMYKDP